MATYIIAVMAIYFIVIIGVSLLGRKHATNFHDYLTAGHSSGIIMVAAATAGLDIGNGLVVGGAAEGSVVGLSGMAYGVGCTLAIFTVVFVLNDFIFNRGYASLADYLRERYNGDSLPAIYNAVVTISTLGSIAAQLMAGKAVFEAFDMDGRIGVFAIAICVLLYSHISGLWGSYATSVVQTLVISFGLIFVFTVIVKEGGLSVIQDAVNTGVVDKTFTSPIRGYEASAWIACVIPVMLSAFTAPTAYIRIDSAKDIRSAKIGQLVGGLLVLVASILPVVIGMFGRAKYNIEGNSAFIKVITLTMPPIITALMVTAVAAAVMSTIDSQYIAISRVVLNDFYLRHINKNASEKLMSKLTFTLNILVTGIGVALALTETSIISLLSDMYVFFNSAILVPFIGGALWKKGTTIGAVVAAIVGSVAAILQIIGIINLPFYAVTIMIPGLVAYIVVSIATEKKVAITK